MQQIIGFQNALESAQITFAKCVLNRMTAHRLACIAAIILAGQINLSGGTVTMPSRIATGVIKKWGQIHTISRDGLKKHSVKADMTYLSSEKTT